MNAQEAVESIRARHDGCSYYRVAKLLEVDQATVHRYKLGKAQMDDAVAIRAAELLDLPPLFVLASMQAARTTDEKARAWWQQVARTAQAAVLAGALALPSIPGAAPLQSPGWGTGPVYNMSRRRWGWMARLLGLGAAPGPRQTAEPPASQAPFSLHH